MEAFAAGTPVLTSNTTACAEVAGDAALRIDPTSIPAIEKGLERLLTEDDLRAKLQSAGRQRLKAFSWERCARETLAVYRRVLAREQRGSRQRLG